MLPAEGRVSSQYHSVAVHVCMHSNDTVYVAKLALDAVCSLPA